MPTSGQNKFDFPGYSCVKLHTAPSIVWLRAGGGGTESLGSAQEAVPGQSNASLPERFLQKPRTPCINRVPRVGCLVRSMCMVSTGDQ